MEGFNLGMLAKQWWRIIQNSDSLCYNVLKARYFPETEPMKSREYSTASFLWKSLLHGKRIIEVGDVWRIGNGQSVDVWCDKWIKKLPEYKGTPIDHNTPIPLKAECLIDEDDRVWKIDLLRDLF